MTLGSEIRSQLLRCLSDQISIEEFEDWFAPATWNVHQSGDRDAEFLTGVIELLLAEFSSGHLSEAELPRQLWRLMNPPPIVTEAMGDQFTGQIASAETPEVSVSLSAEPASEYQLLCA